jgi:hypothetical protein
VRLKLEYHLLSVSRCGQMPVGALIRVELTICKTYEYGPSLTLSSGKADDAVRTQRHTFIRQIADLVLTIWGWNHSACAQQTDGSMQWIPAQIGGIGEDSQVDYGKAKTTLYKVRWQGYDRKDDAKLPTCDDKGVHR